MLETRTRTRNGADGDSQAAGQSAATLVYTVTYSYLVYNYALLCFAFVVYLVVISYGDDFLLRGLHCFMGLREFEGFDGVLGHILPSNGEAPA